MQPTRHSSRPKPEHQKVPGVEIDHGHVCAIHPDKGTGCIETRDGRVIHFYKDSVQNCRFDSLKRGVEVRFKEEADEKGSRAAIVQVID